jgi:hypothetical protein
MKTQLRNALMAVILLLIPILNFAQAPPLGTAANFVLFTSVGAVTNVGTYKYLTHLTGNVGTNSGSSTNFGNVNGVMHDNDGASALCAADVLFAYNALAAAIPDSTLGPVIGNGTTLKAKTYLMPGATALNLGLTLNAQGNSNAVFIFKTPIAVAYAFTANPNAKIHLINGAQACNVFWLVSGAFNMGTAVTMRGSIVAGGAISMGAQDTLEGRALTINGAITVSNGALGFLAYTPIGCGSPNLNGPTAPTFVGLGSYVVFATTGSNSDCGTSHVTGDVGGNTVAPTGWNPLFVSGGIYFNNPSTAAAAADLLLIYNNLLGLAYDIKLLDPAEFGHSLVLTPHTYQMDAAVTFTDTIFLDALGNADAVFIIKTYGAFASTPGSQVKLVNGTQAKNVYWFVTGAVSITANSNFKGAIIAHDAIDILTGASLDGRAFSTNGAISTCGMTATIPSTSIISTQPSNQTACVGSSVSFSVTASGTGLTYQWRKGSTPITNVAGHISGATTNTLTINPVLLSDAATNYNVIVFVPPSGPNDTSANVSLVVTPTVGTPTVITISAGTEPTCQLTNGTTTTTYATTATNNTGLNWSLSNIAAGVIGATTGLMTWANGFSGTVNIQVTASGCNGPSAQVIRTITVAPPVGTPSTPTPSGTIICQGSVPTTYTTSANNATSYNWTVTGTGNTISGTGTTGTVTWAPGYSGIAIVSVTANGCSGPSASGSTTITVNPTNTITLTSAGGTTAQTLCISTAITNITYSATGATGSTVTGLPAGITGTWTANVITISGTPTVSGTFNYTVTLTGGCGTIIATGTITVNPLPVPIITGQSTMCINSGYYDYTTAPGMTGYIWSVSAPGGVINYGSGTNQITVSWIAAGPQTVSVNYTNLNGCTAATPTVFNVTVIPLPNQIGTITGTANVCAGTNGVTYTVAPIPNTTTYVWTLPPYATIASGMGTNSITVNYGTNALSGNIFVYGNNLCGNGTSSPPFAVTVAPLPDLAGTIAGPSSVCQGTSGAVYSVGLITNATGYAWTVPADYTIVGGANTNSIAIDFSPTAVSGTITVNGTNSCGNGPVSPDFEVTVNPIPAAPVVTNIGNTLYSDAPTGNQWYFEGTLIVGATAQTYDATQTGYYWSVVTLNGCSSAESNHQYIIIVGVDSHSSSAINVYPVPNDGRFTVSIISSSKEPFTITVFSNLGVKIHEVKDIHVNSQFYQVIDLRPVFNGIYTVVIRNSIYHIVKKVVVSR